MSNIPGQSWRRSAAMESSGRPVSRRFPVWTPREHPRITPGPSTDDIQLPPDFDIMDKLEKTPLRIISIPNADREEDYVQIKDCTYIGSYNWVNGEILPTILVPGSPPLWRNRPLPYKVSPDTGIHIRDESGYRIPKAILLPLIEAVNKVNIPSPFDWASVDIMTDRNNLRKLAGWVAKNPNLKHFRIDLQLAGNRTVLMNRWEPRAREMLSGYTFRFNFEEASTEPAPGCKDSTSHHRIVTYDLSGLKMVVRFEVHAAIPRAKYPRRSASDVDEITKMMNDAKLSQATGGVPGGQLRIVEGGTQISSSAVIEFNTRAQTRLNNHGFDWKVDYPQMFFSQTANHFLAIHDRGHFVDIQKRNLASEEYQAAEDDAQVEIKKVRKVLDLIKELVIEHGSEGRISLVCDDGELKVYKRISDESCLPEEIMSLFQV